MLSTSLNRRASRTRDIKPDNIGVAAASGSKKRLILFDFSLSRTRPRASTPAPDPVCKGINRAFYLWLQPTIGVVRLDRELIRS